VRKLSSRFVDLDEPLDVSSVSSGNAAASTGTQAA
jgi:hypothetical protein